MSLVRQLIVIILLGFSVKTDSCPVLPAIGSPVNLFSVFFRSFFRVMQDDNAESQLTLVLFNSREVEDVVTSRSIWRLSFNDSKTNYIGILSTFPKVPKADSQHNIIRFIQSSDILDAQRLLGLYEGSEVGVLPCASLKSNFRDFFRSDPYTPINPDPLRCYSSYPPGMIFPTPVLSGGSALTAQPSRNDSFSSLLTPQSIDSIDVKPVNIATSTDDNSYVQLSSLVPQLKRISGNDSSAAAAFDDQRAQSKTRPFQAASSNIPTTLPSSSSTSFYSSLPSSSATYSSPTASYSSPSPTVSYSSPSSTVTYSSPSPTVTYSSPSSSSSYMRYYSPSTTSSSDNYVRLQPAYSSPSVSYSSSPPSNSFTILQPSSQQPSSDSKSTRSSSSSSTVQYTSYSSPSFTSSSPTTTVTYSSPSALQPGFRTLSSNSPGFAARRSDQGGVQSFGFSRIQN